MASISSDVRRLFARLLIAICSLSLALPLFAADRQVHILRETGDLLLQIQGDEDDDWFIQSSADLTNWTTIPSLGTLLSNPTNTPVRSLGPVPETPFFYRALRTQGLYDTNLLRTIELTFTNSDWQTLLAVGRTNGSNTPALLRMPNGANIAGVGARYKGNSSYISGGEKKPINIEIDFSRPDARLMGYKTINLNNAAEDPTVMREVLYFNIVRQYVPCPEAAICKVVINNTNWGVYNLVAQENNDLIDRYFRSNKGDRWRTPNQPFSPSAFNYLGTDTNAYLPYYDLRSNNSTNAWNRLVTAITNLHFTPTAEFREKIENYFAVDSWLWFFALENAFADEDSYWGKGADFSFYYEIESGRIHPVQHDGNESFNYRHVSLSPLPAFAFNRPPLFKLLDFAELRGRYLAHFRTVLEEHLNPPTITAAIDYYHQLSFDEIAADPKRNYSMEFYTNDLRALKVWVTNRYNYLIKSAPLAALAPTITGVYGPTNRPGPTEAAIITAQVEPAGTNGVDSVWLYWRDKTYGVFSRAQMFDDGAHGDGSAGDRLFGAATTNYPAGHKIHYYVEARSANVYKSAVFAPRRAEIAPYSYRVGLVSAPSTPVVINEIMASNASTIADPQGEFDDWIELHNITDAEVDLSGWHLSDEPNNPRKWRFPDGTKIPARGFLLVWADEDGRDTPGLHASFKLSADGEAIFLTDTDANQNAVLDSLDFGPQQTDRSYGRPSANPDEFVPMNPTPGAAN